MGPERFDTEFNKGVKGTDVAQSGIEEKTQAALGRLTGGGPQAHHRAGRVDGHAIRQ
ncbi:hypothetical protein ACFYMW_39890 [Streptomyces sp. NPDC006692]|uniref:hypothetical protein n=1 Tax=unclassified Streptomyces TaxID=2593676 RepID=UPI0036BAE5FA